MTDKESEISLMLRGSISALQEDQFSAISKVAKSMTKPRIFSLVEQVGFDAKLYNNSASMTSIRGFPNSLLQISNNWNNLPIKELSRSLLGSTSSPSFIGAIDEIRSLSGIKLDAMQTFYDSPSYKAMSNAFSSMGTQSLQSLIDSIPDDFYSDINDFEQELENDTDTQAKFQPILDSMGEVLSSQVGAKLDFSKSGLTESSIKLFFYAIILILHLYGPYLLIPNPTDELVEISKQDLEEQKRHNAVMEQNQNISIESQQDQAADTKELLEVSKDMLSELKKANEQKKDSK